MDIKMVRFQEHGDERGALVALEENKNIPFPIKRVYYLYNTGEGIRRGYHAHKTLKQVLFCPCGACTIMLDDGKEKAYVRLDNPAEGLFIESNMWREMYDFTPNAVLMVLASDYYKEEDYIRDYDRFLESLSE